MTTEEQKEMGFAMRCFREYDGQIPDWVVKEYENSCGIYQFIEEMGCELDRLEAGLARLRQYSSVRAKLL